MSQEENDSLEKFLKRQGYVSGVVEAILLMIVPVTLFLLIDRMRWKGVE